MIATQWELENLTGIVYLWTNKINGKKLVGLSRNSFYDRYGRNFSSWLYQASNEHFRSALKKYGPDNFIIEILEYSQFIPSLQALESYYIAKFQSNNSDYGYNKTTGGEINFTSNIKKPPKIL